MPGNEFEANRGGMPVAVVQALDEEEAWRRMALDPEGRREFGPPDDGGPAARAG